MVMCKTLRSLCRWPSCVSLTSESASCWVSSTPRPTPRGPSYSHSASVRPSRSSAYVYTIHIHPKDRLSVCFSCKIICSKLMCVKGWCLVMWHELTGVVVANRMSAVLNMEWKIAKHQRMLPGILLASKVDFLLNVMFCFPFNPFYTKYAPMRSCRILPNTHRCVFTNVSAHAAMLWPYWIN